MDMLRPIHTVSAECQDCYKCVRECPVKAIRIHQDHAEVVPDLCINCGHCVQVCPVGAKHGRSDLNRARRLLTLKRAVYVSLAPSHVTEFGEWSTAALIAALRDLGFAGVSETALGAEAVSSMLVRQLAASPGNRWLSSACPAVVDYIRKYRPELIDRLTAVASPLLAHCRLLRQTYGADIGIVFVGPCLGKKAEADAHPELLDLAITFRELRTWLEEAALHPRRLSPDADDRFVPEPAADGVLYPIDGGMCLGLQRHGASPALQTMTFSGMDAIHDALAGFDREPATEPVFLELLACPGGCVNGVGATRRGGTASKRLQVFRQPGSHQPARPAPPVAVDLAYERVAIQTADYPEARLREALRDVGKFVRADELNCGGCGYDTCRGFAVALLDGKAERQMCVSYMRQLAAKKANALMRTMPSGVIIVGDDLRVIESNRRFADLMGDEVGEVYDAKPGLEGAVLAKLVPFHDLFATVLRTGQEKLEKDLRVATRVLHATIFTIEPHRLVGGLFQDITVPAVQKERIVNQAREVITRNLATVQQIAFLLGENAADSEVILNSIIDSFTPEPVGPEAGP